LIKNRNGIRHCFACVGFKILQRLAWLGLSVRMAFPIFLKKYFKEINRNNRDHKPSCKMIHQMVSNKSFLILFGFRLHNA
jgi:hypothetical protein